MLSTTIIKTQHEGKYFGGTFSPFSRFPEICRQHASIYWSSPTPYEDKLIEIEIYYLSVSTSLYLESHGKIPEMVHIMQKKNIEEKKKKIRVYFKKGTGIPSQPDDIFTH